MPPGSRRRNPLLWPAVQVLGLVLPLVVASRLNREVSDAMDRLVAADLFVGMVLPWALAIGLFLGLADDWFVPTDKAADASARLRATSWRMLGVLTVAPASLWVIQPPDVLAFSSHWRWMGAGLAVGVIPLWSVGSLVRARGLPRWSALVLSTGFAGTLAAGTMLLCRAAFLSEIAALSPLAATGVVASIGVYLAASERVDAGLSSVLVATGTLAVLLGGGMALVLAGAPIENVWVRDVVAMDVLGRRATVQVDQANIRGRRVEVSLQDGAPTPLGRRVRRVAYVGGVRLEAEAPWLGVLRGRRPGLRPCAVSPGGERTCVAATLTGGPTVIERHPRRPLGLVGDSSGLIVWDVAQSKVWQVQREGRLRWPCFSEGGDVIWRIQMSDGPYQNEILRLASAPAGTPRRPGEASRAVQALPLDHEERCAEGTASAPSAQFVRGRQAVGRAASLRGPGLDEAGVELQGEVGLLSWSADGLTASVPLGRPRTLAIYRADLGLTPAAPLPRATAPTLSASGELLAFRAANDGMPYPVEVRAVPGLQRVWEGTSESTRVPWDGRGRLLRVEEGRLYTVDPLTGDDRLLFPPLTAGDAPRGS